MFSVLVIAATVAVIALLALTIKLVGSKTTNTRFAQSFIAGVAFMACIVGASVAF